MRATASGPSEAGSGASDGVPLRSKPLPPASPVQSGRASASTGIGLTVRRMPLCSDIVRALHQLQKFHAACEFVDSRFPAAANLWRAIGPAGPERRLFLVG